MTLDGCEAQTLEGQLYPRTIASERIERMMKLRMAISDRSLLIVESDGDRVFWPGLKAL